MKSFLHNLSRVAMLDLSAALASGRLKPPYSALRTGEYVPLPIAGDIGLDLARMDAGGMKPAHCRVPSASGSRTGGQSANSRSVPVGLDRT
ncbi:MAG: hypothetical protein IPP47_22945 [Bryobacterales bacterium]|nr:hypothetical protein [Bryobacterales bacterium]